jgi:antitoxin YefM
VPGQTQLGARISDLVVILTRVDEVLPFTQAKTQLSELVDRVEREHARLTLTRRGRPAATLMHPDDLAALEETIEILRDKELATSIRRSRAESAAGKRKKLKRPR